MGSIEAPPDLLNVCIVGAGPVGLALALDLGQRGIRTTILERKPGVASVIEAKASVINERTMEYARRLGVRDEIANSGYPHDLPGDTVFSTSLNGKFIGRLEMPSAEGRDLPDQSSEMLQRCPQFWFDPILARAVVRQKMTQVRYGVEVVDAEEQDGDHVLLSLRVVENGRQEELRARYVVACDGPSSTLRKGLGIVFEGKDLGHTLSSVVDVDILKYQPFGRAAERYLFIGPDGTWGNFTTIDGGTLWRFSVVGMEGKVDDLATFDIGPLVKQALGRDDIPFTVKRVLQWRRSQYTADKYHSGRIVLAGDAAHTMSPTGGHGLNTGLGDTSDLAWMLQALIEGWGGPRLLSAYDLERRPIAIRNGTTSTKNFSVWKAGKDKVLDDGREADEQRATIGENMAANMRQEFQALGLALGYSYAYSPLVVQDGSAAPPDDAEIYIQTARPGHRAPHVWLDEKKSKSMVDLFGKNFVLLRFGCQQGATEREYDAIRAGAKDIDLPLECVDVDNQEAAALYMRRLVLVRPDGMVAWRGDSLEDAVEVGRILDVVRGCVE